MQINILEDDIIQQQKLKRYLVEIMQANNWPHQQISTYSRPEQLLANLTSRGTHHIYFLDVELKGSDRKGFEVAKQIREHDPYAIIIFVTTHSEFLPLTFKYQVSALDFIAKDQDAKNFKQQLENNLQHIVQQFNVDMPLDLFQFNTPKANFKIPFSDILYFETQPGTRQIILVGMTKRIEFTGQLQDIATMDNRLFRSHRAYLVNINNIEQIDKVSNVIIFKNQSTCLISRRKVKALISIL
ncbi:response regulator transcription factor [Leuconostoc miyukkimchii]|uniref:response regulator transcription factor n=1 Tax=Leuconostoc miyukkimchii TaxID=910540 RepID=UPI001C7DA7DE|nr:response regulator transcription factor [Leuconostoc miyukkimchii]